MTTKHTPGPVTGPYHGPSIADQLRLIGSLCGTDHPTGKAEQRAAVAYVSVVTAEMLAALKELTVFRPYLEKHMDDADKSAWSKARDIIAKAEGRDNG